MKVSYLLVSVGVFRYLSVFFSWYPVIDIIVITGTVPVERRSHSTVAFPEWMYMTQWDGKDDRVVKHVSYVDIRVILRYDQEVIGLVIIVLSIFYRDVIDSVDIEVYRIKTSVAWHLDHPLACECAVEGIILLDKIEMHVHVRR